MLDKEGKPGLAYDVIFNPNGALSRAPAAAHTSRGDVVALEARRVELRRLSTDCTRGLRGRAVIEASLDPTPAGATMKHFIVGLCLDWCVRSTAIMRDCGTVSRGMTSRGMVSRDMLREIFGKRAFASRKSGVERLA